MTERVTFAQLEEDKEKVAKALFELHQANMVEAPAKAKTFARVAAESLSNISTLTKEIEQRLTVLEVMK